MNSGQSIDSATPVVPVGMTTPTEKAKGASSIPTADTRPPATGTKKDVPIDPERVQAKADAIKRYLAKPENAA